MLPILATLVASLASQASFTQYHLALSANTRYDTGPDELASARATSLQVSPDVGLDVTEQSIKFGVAYHPMLNVFADSSPAQVLHQASLRLGLKPSSRFEMVARAEGSYGTSNFRLQPLAPTAGTQAGPAGTPGTAPQPPAPPPAVQPVPSAVALRYLSGLGGVSVDSQIDSRVRLQGEAAYVVQGGADAAARAVLPLGRGPTVALSVIWQPVRDHALSTRFAGSYSEFLRPAGASTAELGDTAWTAQLVEGWRYRLGPSFSLSAAAGGATAAQSLSARSILPVGEVGFSAGLGTVTAAFSARVAPFVDYTSGSAYERGDAGLYLGWPPSRDWRLEATASAGTVLQGVQRGQWTGTGQIAAKWDAARWARLLFGLSVLWQEAGSAFPASSVQQWTVFVGGHFLYAGRF